MMCHSVPNTVVTCITGVIGSDVPWLECPACNIDLYWKLCSASCICMSMYIRVYMYVHYGSSVALMYMCCCVRVDTYFKVTNKPYEAG